MCGEIPVIGDAGMVLESIKCAVINRCGPLVFTTMPVGPVEDRLIIDLSPYRYVRVSLRYLLARGAWQLGAALCCRSDFQSGNGPDKLGQTPVYQFDCFGGRDWDGPFRDLDKVDIVELIDWIVQCNADALAHLPSGLPSGLY